MSYFWENEIPEGYYDKAISFNEKSHYSTQSNWHKTTFESVSNIIDNSKTLLDFACGSGTFLGHYIKKETSVGVDISETQILYAKKKYQGRGSFFTLDEFKFEDYKNHFDTITCLGLFEFISLEEADYFLEKFKYCLNDNGKIIISTPNFKLVMRTIEFILSRFGNIDYSEQYKTKYNKKTFTKILKSHKFKKFKIKKIISLFIFLSSVNGKLALKLNKKFTDIFKGNTGLLLVAEIQK